MRQSPMTLYDPRALFGEEAVPTRPDDAASVAAAFAGQSPGLRLTLVAEKHIRAYSAWLWEGDDGQAYYSKRMKNGRVLAWRPKATVARVLAASPSMREAHEKKEKSNAK